VKNEDTKPMRRLPDSPPRIPPHLRFYVWAGIGMDLAMLVLILVFSFTPLHPVYPDSSVPSQLPQPRIASVVLPAPVSPPRSAPVTHSQAPVVHRVATSPPKPSARPSAVRTSTAPTVPATITMSPESPPPTSPTDTESP